MQTVTRTAWGVRIDTFDGREEVFEYDDQRDAWEHLADYPRGQAVLVSQQVTRTSWTPRPRSLFPVPGGRVTCGARTWLPRAERVHDWVPLGPDVRNCGERGFLELQVSACRECGADRAAGIVGRPT